MERIKQLLQAKGLKVTTQRIIVYQVMERLRHATADSVAKEVRAVVPTITVATVYHILESLYQADLISRLDTRDGKIGYDITAKTHHHLFDGRKRRIQDYDDAGLTTRSSRVSRSASRSRIFGRGRCDLDRRPIR